MPVFRIDAICAAARPACASACLREVKARGSRLLDRTSGNQAKCAGFWGLERNTCERSTDLETRLLHAAENDVKNCHITWHQGTPLVRPLYGGKCIWTHQTDGSAWSAQARNFLGYAAVAFAADPAGCATTAQFDTFGASGACWRVVLLALATYLAWGR